MEDGEAFPLDFNEWEKNAENDSRGAASHSVVALSRARLLSCPLRFVREASAAADARKVRKSLADISVPAACAMKESLRAR